MKKIALGLASIAIAATMTACGGGDGATADAGNFCAQAQDFTELQDTAGDLFTGAGSDADSVKESWGKITDELKAFEDAAPDDIGADIATVSEGFDAFTGALEEVDYSVTALIAKAATDPDLVKQFEALDSPDVEAAAKRVEDYVSAECGIDLESEG